MKAFAAYPADHAQHGRNRRCLSSPQRSQQKLPCQNDYRVSFLRAPWVFAGPSLSISATAAICRDATRWSIPIAPMLDLDLSGRSTMICASRYWAAFRKELRNSRVRYSQNVFCPEWKHPVASYPIHDSVSSQTSELSCTMLGVGKFVFSSQKFVSSGRKFRGVGIDYLSF